MKIFVLLGCRAFWIFV